MTLERKLVYIAVLACLVPILAWLCTFWSPVFSTENHDWAAFGDFVGGVISPVLAFASFLCLLVTLRHQQQAINFEKISRQEAIDVEKTARDDQKFYEYAVTNLARAHEALLSDDEKKPRRDRVAWLTCARLLLSANDVSHRISEKSEGLRTMYEGESEYWRRQFYILLEPHSPHSIGANRKYFDGDSPRDGKEIEERSIRVIYDFVKWPEQVHEPIDSVPLFSREELKDMKVGMSGIQQYVQSKGRFKTD